MLVEPNKNLQFFLQSLTIKSFMRFHIKWKNDPKVEALWELENELKEIYQDFVIEDNDLTLEEKSLMHQLENKLLRIMENYRDGCPRLRNVDDVNG